jgi:predicted DNA-binding antitoxin AbrB/MazE fold protein
MKTIHAIYENGVFRPTEPVELPEASEVVFELRVLDSSRDLQHLRRVQKILSQRSEFGERDTAERHNEHQP